MEEIIEAESAKMQEEPEAEPETEIQADGQTAKKTKRKLSKRKKIILAVVLPLVALFVLFGGIKAGEKLWFLHFYQNGKAEFRMPGYSTGFVGQGLDFVEEHNAFISCGYAAKKGEASSVYITDSNGKSRQVLLQGKDGSNYTGHTGGIAHYREYFYVTGETGCDVFLLSDLFDENVTETKMLGSVETSGNLDHDPAYCNVYGGKLYVGSFYRSGNFETADWQRMTTPAGDGNTSAIKVFEMDDGAVENYYVGALESIYSTPNLVQGMTFTDGQIVLSTSYGLATSHLLFYDMPTEAHTVEGIGVPVYYLDKSNLKTDVSAPPMSEEIVFKDGKIFIMCESASNKYIFGKFLSGINLYSYKI